MNVNIGISKAINYNVSFSYAYGSINPWMNLSKDRSEIYEDEDVLLP